MRQKIPARLSVSSIASLSMVLVVGCMRAPVPPPPIVPCPVVFTQPGQVIGEGVADDALDALPGVNPVGGDSYGPTPALPARAADGAASVDSIAGAFNALRANVIAWKDPASGRRLPRSWAHVTGTTTLGVSGPNPVVCQFKITSGARVQVKGGTTRYRIRAEIFDATDAPVRGASYVVLYEFRETTAGTIDYYAAQSQGAVPLRRIATLPADATGSTNPTDFAAARIAPDLGPPAGFMLAPGTTYIVRYTLTAEGDATRQTAPPSIFADVDADATFEIVTFP